MIPRQTLKRCAATTAVLGIGFSTAMCASPNSSSDSSGSASSGSATSESASGQPQFVTANDAQTSTPIKHLVVIFPENVSFDHYFATYPKAANVPDEKQQGTGVAAPAFTAKEGTPQANNLVTNLGTDKDKDLLTNNPNSVQPFRLTPEQAVTTDQGHNYDKEQKAYNDGKMDKFVESTSVDADKAKPGQYARDKGTVMGYYDGNTVTGMWNYAQNYAMSDNSWTTTFGPSTPGAINLVAGNILGAKQYAPVTETNKETGEKKSDAKLSEPKNAKEVPFKVGDYGFSLTKNDQDTAAVTGDPDPAFDDCTDGSNHAGYTDRKTVGDSMNEKGITWGWFQAGFKPTKPYDEKTNTPAECGAKSKNVAGIESEDYIAHHQPFQYFASTANPHQLPPSSVDKIGQTDQANHQYDMSDFDDALKADNMPSVSFLKAPAAEDGHPAYSGPLDEQKFVVNTINKIQDSKFWKDTAVVIAYDDSDGWYDHQAPKVVNGSDNDTKVDGKQTYGADSEICKAVPNQASGPGFCGPGTRVPLLVVSPYAKVNHVDHNPTEQASVLSFIEKNWDLGELGNGLADKRAGSLDGLFDFNGSERAKPVKLDPNNGTVVEK